MRGLHRTSSASPLRYACLAPGRSASLSSSSRSRARPDGGICDDHFAPLRLWRSSGIVAGGGGLWLTPLTSARNNSTTKTGVTPDRASAKSWMRCSRIPFRAVWGRQANRRCRSRTKRSGASSAAFSSGADDPTSKVLRRGRSTPAPTFAGDPIAKALRGCFIPTACASSDAGRSLKRRLFGYFARGRTALVVARYSSGGGGSLRGRVRSLALVGKLFPTTDPDHPTPLRTANFITQEDIGGARSDSINEAELRNAPDVTVFRRGAAGTILIKVAAVFRRVDKEGTMRQLYPIAELGKPAGEPTRAPEFMRLLVAKGQPVIPGADLDVRDEVMAHIFDRGDPAPKRTLTFTIEVTDDGRRRDRRSGCAARSGTGGGLARSSSTTPSCRTTAMR